MAGVFVEMPEQVVVEVHRPQVLAARRATVYMVTAPLVATRGLMVRGRLSLIRATR